jgi:hypothetical protein
LGIVVRCQVCQLTLADTIDEIKLDGSLTALAVGPSVAEMDAKPSANLIFAVVVFIGVLVFFSAYRFHPDIFPAVERLPPPG